MVLRADLGIPRSRGEERVLGRRGPFFASPHQKSSPRAAELPPAQPGGGHRVKNVLATVNAVAAHTMDASSSMEHFVAALDGRIRSMASTHELLSDRRWEGVPLASLLLRELEAYTSTTNTNLEGPEVLLRAEAGQAIASVFHELVTNAAKHGALSKRKGRVAVQWFYRRNGHEPGGLTLHWRKVRR